MSLALSGVTLQLPHRFQLTGHSAAMSALRRQIEQIAATSARILVTGESGVGKGLVVRTIHARSTRSQAPFELVSCAGLAEALLEAELFGTGLPGHPDAWSGKIEAAHRGTLFLDEIGELPLRLQTRMLRFVETGDLQNGRQSLVRSPDVRIVTSTSRSLPAMIEAGTFKPELYYRLNVVHIHVPPLRERAEDIPPLVEYFLQQFASVHNVSVRQVTPEALEVLAAHRWPGNVRELENIVERAVLTGRGPIVPADLPDEVRFGAASVSATPVAPSRLVDDLYRSMVDGQESFWRVVYPKFMHRELTRDEVRDLVRRSLIEARGNYRLVAQMFNMAPGEYKRFLNFLKQHDCHVPYQQYRRNKRNAQPAAAAGG